MKPTANVYHAQDLVRMIVLAVVYSAIAILVSSIFLDLNKINLLWPCSGLALVILLKFGIRYLPVIFIGELIGNLYAGFGPLNAAVLASLICTESIAGYLLLSRRLGFNASLQKPNDYFSLGIAAVISASFSAFLGSIYLHAQGELANQTLISSMLHWLQGDLLGIVGKISGKKVPTTL